MDKINFYIEIVNREYLDENIRYIKSLYSNINLELFIGTEKECIDKYNNIKKEVNGISVFIKENVFIINKEFIKLIVDRFNNNRLQLLGIRGSKDILRTLEIENTNFYGNYFHYKNALNHHNVYDDKPNYIDNSIFILRNGNYIDYNFKYLYLIDVINNIYQSNDSVQVLYSSNPICIIEKTNFIYDREEIREEFNSLIKKHNLYYKYPLVSVLIPTYNQVNFLEKALNSAINQTYPRIEIIIGDDSTNDEVKKLVEEYLNRYSYISYYKNKNTGDYGIRNVKKLLDLSKGDYINFLFHDDLFYKNKIEKMINKTFEFDNLSFITCQRQLIDDKGLEIQKNNNTFKFLNTDTLLTKENILYYLSSSRSNFIGEPTAVLFRADIKHKFGEFNNKKYINIVDIASWINFLSYGNGLYLSEPLCNFRIHDKQNSRNRKIEKLGQIEWNELQYSICKQGYIPENKMYCVICGSIIDNFLPYEGKINKRLDYLEIIGSNVDNFLCPTCKCTDRERHLFMFFNELNIGEKYINDKSILHIAPENKISLYIEMFNFKKYIRGDLYPINEKTQEIDITKIPYNDNEFDLIICNHVLEHILDDSKALKELYRVLKNKGNIILQTPYSGIIQHSIEDTSNLSNRDRFLKFGQEDHCRIYGTDIFERIEKEGFKNVAYKNKDLFSKEICNILGVNYLEDLMMFKAIKEI